MVKLIKYKFYGNFQTTSFRYVKILWDTIEELFQKINSLNAKSIISIKSDVADETTLSNCSGVYYEYYEHLKPL